MDSNDLLFSNKYLYFQEKKLNVHPKNFNELTSLSFIVFLKIVLLKHIVLVRLAPELVQTFGPPHASMVCVTACPPAMTLGFLAHIYPSHAFLLARTSLRENALCF